VEKAEEKGVGWVEGRGQEVKNALAGERRRIKRPQTAVAAAFFFFLLLPFLCRFLWQISSLIPKF